MSKASNDVWAERQRQIEAEGWTSGHDDDHRRGELAAAAECYTYKKYATDITKSWPDKPIKAPKKWPWGKMWWKPKTYRENLVRAGALYMAEADRCTRKAESVTAEIERVDREKRE